MNLFTEQLGRIRQQVADLANERTTTKLGTVTAVNTGAGTFTASIPGMNPLSGIAAPPEFMPTVGSTARLTLNGATPTFETGAIAYLAPEKAVAGTISAQWIVAGGFLTALTGQRSGMTPLGFQAWDSSNNLTVNIDGVNNLITGKYSSGATGTRHIEIGTSGATNKISLMSATGGLAEIGAFAASGGGDALRIGVPISGLSQFWNNIQIQPSETLYSWTAFTKFTVGGNGSTTKGFRVTWATTRGSSTDSTIPEVDRVVLDSTSNNFHHPSAGAFYVTERLTDTDTDLKLKIGGGTFFYHNVGQGFQIQEKQVGDTLASRFNLTQTAVWFQWPSTNGRMVIFPPNLTVSARIQLVNQYSYAATFRFNSGSDGSSQRMELTDANETAYAPLWASAFTVSSSETQKTAIKTLAPGALDTVQSLQVKRFTRRPLPNIDGKPGPTPRQEIGLIAEEVAVAAPDLVVAGGEMGPGIDMASTVGMLIASVQELAAKVTALEGTP